MNITTETTLKWYGPAYIDAMFAEMFTVYNKTANKVRDDAKSRVPKQTGELADTIRARSNKNKNIAFVFAGDRDRLSSYYTRGGQPIGIYWAHMVEFGTYFEPARPFMRPAADSNFNPLKAESKHMAQRVINQERRDKAKITRTKSK